jgi:hypothetical protein
VLHRYLPPAARAVKVNKSFRLPVAIYRSYLGPVAALRRERRQGAGSGMSTDRWISTFNATNWRMSTFNGALLAAYFIPTWAIVASRIAASPVQGFYERPNISVALYLNDYLRVAATDLTRFAWLLALGRLTAVAFFIVFLVQIMRPAVRKAGECDEALGLALGIGSLISFAGMVMASQVGETAALRLHATELLLLLGTGIVLLVERPAQARAHVDGAGNLALQQPQLLNNR